MDLLNFFFSKKPTGSGGTAASRLKFVLMQDRINCSAKVLELMKADILQVISKYMEIDDHALDIQVSEGKSPDGKYSEPSIFFDIPIKSIKGER